jgi:hypothetical protein
MQFQELSFAHYPVNLDEAGLIIDTALQTTAYSARAAIHSTFKISPGTLVFHRDMILDIPLVADLELIRQRRQALIDEQHVRQNRRRISHDYQPHDEVQIITYKPAKLDPEPVDPIASYVSTRMVPSRSSVLRSSLNVSTSVDYALTNDCNESFYPLYARFLS